MPVSVAEGSGFAQITLLNLLIAPLFYFGGLLCLFFGIRVKAIAISPMSRKVMSFIPLITSMAARSISAIIAVMVFRNPRMSAMPRRDSMIPWAARNISLETKFSTQMGTKPIQALGLVRESMPA